MIAQCLSLCLINLGINTYNGYSTPGAGSIVCSLGANSNFEVFINYKIENIFLKILQNIFGTQHMTLGLLLLIDYKFIVLR